MQVKKDIYQGRYVHIALLFFFLFFFKIWEKYVTLPMLAYSAYTGI